MGATVQGLNVGFPTANTTIGASGITSTNTNVIICVNPLSSYDPTATLNSLTSFAQDAPLLLDMKQATTLAWLQTTSGGLSTPAAPTTPVTDDTNNTFGWTDTGGKTYANAEYTLNGGSSWTNATANPQTGIGDANRAIGQVGVRYKAVSGASNASAPLYNTTAFTSTGPLHLSNFTAADNTVLSAYTPDSGSAWTLGPGSWKIVSNKAQTDGSADATNHNYSAKTPVTVSSNYKVTAVAETAANGMYRQILMKMNSGETDGIVLNISETGIDVIELTSGTPAATSFQLPSGAQNGLSSATFEVTVNGTALSLKKDGVSYERVSNAAATVTVGAHSGNLFGMGNANTGTITAGAVKFDSFRVENI